MTPPRFLCPDVLTADAVGSEYVLPGAVAHHALRVLRLAVGDDLTLFTGGGGEFAARLVHADRRTTVVRVVGFDPVEREARLAVTLAQGIAASDAMDHAIRRAVELGVAAIQPIVTTRSARVPEGGRREKRLAHWRQIVVAACEQCGRNRLPEVHQALPLEQWLAARRRDLAGLMLAPDAEVAMADVTPPGNALDVLIGPEGGFAAEEIAVARRAGMVAVRMGPRVLRTETAALAALATVNALWGDFR